MTTDEPVPCERCGQPHARCSAHRRDGQPCTQRPMHGQRVCKMHGGKSPGAVEKAAERQAEAAAEKAIAKMIPLVSSSAPVKDPIDLLARVAGMLEVATDKVGGRVEQLTHIGAGEHLTQLRAEVVLWEKLLGHLRAVARDLAALGIAERQVELAAGQADLVVAAFRAGLAAGGALIVPDVRDEMLRAFLEALGRGPVVAGEVAS